MASKENQEALDSVVSLVAELTNTPLSYMKASSEAQTLQKAIDDLEQTEKALDRVCEILYEKGFDAPCAINMCTVATTCYPEDEEKHICSNCIKSFILDEIKEQENESQSL